MRTKRAERVRVSAQSEGERRAEKCEVRRLCDNKSMSASSFRPLPTAPEAAELAAEAVRHQGFVKPSKEDNNKNATESKPEQQQAAAEQKPAAALEEDDEFEEFAVAGTTSILCPLLYASGASMRVRDHGG